MSVLVWCAVGLLGGLGALARYAIDWLVSMRFGFGFPFGTLAVNASGAFLLGLVVGASLSGNAYLLAGTAVLGSYTTFSTWMLETQQLAQRGRGRAAIANLALSTAIGLAAVVLGRVIAGGS
jgi:CrcB protein